MQQHHQLNCSVKRIQEYLLTHHFKRPIGDKKSAQTVLSTAASDHYIISEYANQEAQETSESSSWLTQVKWLNDDIPWRVKVKLMKAILSYWQSFRHCFREIKDPSTGHKKAGSVVVILFVVLLRIMVAAGSATNVVRFGTNQRLKWLRVIVGQDAINKIPSEASIQRLVCNIDGQELGLRAIQFTMLRRKQLNLPMTGLTIAWDAKTSRGSKDVPNSDYLHTDTYMDHQTRETLAVVPTGWLAKETQTLLDTMAAEIIPIKANMITADAFHGKPLVAEAISKHGGD